VTLFDVSPLSPAEVDHVMRGKSRRGDPDTSRSAAAAISSSAEQAIRALYAIPRALTDDELAELLPEWFPPTLKSARSRLARDGFLCDSGERRLSGRGHPMIVWKRNESRA
jgi:hypothetical protein